MYFLAQSIEVEGKKSSSIDETNEGTKRKIGDDLDIFLSYATVNRDFVDRIRRDLEQRGKYKVWMDKHRIQGGDDWEEQLESNIRKCKVFIVTVTSDSNKSEWVKRECILASGCRKKIIPLLRNSDLPFRLNNIQFIDFRQDNRYEESFQSLFMVLQKHFSGVANVPKMISANTTEKGAMMAPYAYVGYGSAISSPQATTKFNSVEQNVVEASLSILTLGFNEHILIRRIDKDSYSILERIINLHEWMNTGKAKHTFKGASTGGIRQYKSSSGSWMNLNEGIVLARSEKRLYWDKYQPSLHDNNARDGYLLKQISLPNIGEIHNIKSNFIDENRSLKDAGYKRIQQVFDKKLNETVQGC